MNYITKANLSQSIFTSACILFGNRVNSLHNLKLNLTRKCC